MQVFMQDYIWALFIFCDYPRLFTFPLLLLPISVKAHQKWKLSPRSYKNKTKSFCPGVKFSSQVLQPSLFFHHPSPYSLLPFPFIYQVFHFPTFFSWPYSSLQINFLFVFSSLCSLYGFLFISLHSAAHEMSSLTCCWYLEITSGINTIFLLTRKTTETQKNNSSVGKEEEEDDDDYYYKSHKGKEI